MDGAGEMEEHRAVANKGGSDTPVSDHRATPVHNNHRGTPVNNHRDDAPAADDDAPSHRGNSSTRSRTSEHDNANYGDVSASRLAAAVSPSSTAHHRGGKVRADYLLNFTLPPRPSPAAGGQRSGSTPRRHGFIQTVGQSRDRFINANFRFILSMNMTERRRIALAAQSDLLIGTHGSFSPTTTDSGDEVRWADVEQAIIVAPSAPACPICLCDPPVAPRTSICGHVFCYPCILRYFHVIAQDADGSDNAVLNTPRQQCRCPICFSIIRESDLKSVQYRFTEDHFAAIRAEDSDERGHVSTSGDRRLSPLVTMVLMKKEAHEMNALPRILWRPDICGQLAPNGSEQRACQLQFGRVLLADDAYTMELLRAEREELLLALQRTGAEASEEEELTFIEMALVAVDIRMRDFDERRRLRNAVADTLAPRSSECSFAPTPSYSQLYFYQAADGQQLFLSPLDIRVLKGLFHEYKQFPDRIEVPLADVEELAMSEELRRRCKYLSHVPLSCIVAFGEIDWSRLDRLRCVLQPMIDCSVTDSQQQWTPLVSGANPALTIRPWMSELKARHKRRTAKKRKDELRRAISSKQATASMLEEASIVVSPRQNDLNVFDFDDEMMWQPLQTSNPAQQTPSLAASALASSQSTAALTSSSFATIASKTADETLQEQIQEQRRQQTGNKGRSKSKIVLMSSSSGGRRI